MSQSAIVASIDVLWMIVSNSEGAKLEMVKTVERKLAIALICYFCNRVNNIKLNKGTDWRRNSHFPSGSSKEMIYFFIMASGNIPGVRQVRILLP